MFLTANSMKIVFGISILLIIYVYLGYPLLLSILNLFLKKKNASKEIIPFVSLIISAYNEEKIIKNKIENSLALNYPRDKFEIIIVSDCSSDKTDEIVSSFHDRGVILHRLDERRGKTYGLNQGVPKAKGEIIVFSDANAMYEPDAIEKLVRNFADSSVGYVTGESQYIEERSAVRNGENLYWKYEQFIKRRESTLSSMVGADGAIYAIRKSLYTPLKESDINDLVNPLRIITKGYRGIYEPEAVCWEKTAPTYEGEFRRKVRIVNRSLVGLWRVREALNPFKYGIFSWELISHKLIRWFVPFLMLAAFFSNLAIFFISINPYYGALFLLQCLFYCMAGIGYIQSRKLKQYKLFNLPYYFCLVNFASLRGVIRSLRGEVQVTWEPERQEKVEKIARQGSRAFIIGTIFMVTLLFSILVFTLLFKSVAYWIFLSSVFAVCYVYLGYPIFLGLVTKFKKVEIDKNEIYPTVSLVVPAYNEESVIEAKIKNSLALDYPKDKIKIFISSDGSTDGTNDILKNYAGQGIIINCFSPRAGKIKTLNRTIPLVDSEIVVFSDANTMYETSAIKKLVRNFNDKTVGAVTGEVILVNEHGSFAKPENLYYKYERYIQKKETEYGCMVGVDGAMYAIRRDLFEPPSNNIILDDFVISMEVARQGYRIIYETQASGYEDASPNLKSEFRRKSRIIAGGIQLIKQREGIPAPKQRKLWFQFLSHKLLRWMIPFFLLMLFSANLKLALTEPIFGGDVTFYHVTALIQLLFYLLALGGLLLPQISIMSIPTYFCAVNIASIFGVFKGLMGKQAVTWKTFAKRTVGHKNHKITQNPGVE